MRTLHELAELHQTKQGFAEAYERHFGHLQQEPVTLIEIGVHQGASLRLWNDFFPSGTFVGIDIKEATREFADERTHIFVGDQKDPALLAEAVEAAGPPDIVVDDGSHRVEDQTATLLYLWPRLKLGGWYVVEDTLTSYLERWGMHYRQPGSTMEFLKGIADDLHVRWHEQEPTLPDVHSLHFYPDTCLIHKALQH